MPWIGAAISIGGSLIGGALGGRGSSQAANDQVAATEEGIAENRRQYDQTRADNAPFMQTGTAATQRLRQLLGLDPTYNGSDSGSLTRNFTSADMTADPVYSSGYDFAQKNAADSINSRALANGGYDSGATLKALQAQGVNVANQFGNDAFNRYNTNNTNTYNKLAGTSGAGQTAVNNVTAAGQTASSNITNQIDAAGNARAAGIVGGVNAWGNALSGAGAAATNYSNNQTLQKLIASRNTGGGGYTGTGAYDYSGVNDGWTGY